MKPFPRKFQQSVREKVFIYNLYCARRIYKNYFGILSSRFRVFRTPILLAPDTTIKLVKYALHNQIRKNNCVKNILVLNCIKSSVNKSLKKNNTGFDRVNLQLPATQSLLIMCLIILNNSLKLMLFTSIQLMHSTLSTIKFY